MSQRGGIYRRGNTWTVFWRTDTAEGRKQHTKGGFRTKKEAQQFLTDTLAAIQGGVFREPSKVTLGEFLTERWLPAREMGLRPSTFASYRGLVERHVLPEIGHVQVQQLSPDQLDLFYSRLIARDLAPKTVRNVHVLIHRALRDAVRKNLVPRNVADAADPPKLNRADREEMKTWTPVQLRQFFDGIAHHRLAAAYVLAATTGMRRGEVLGVRWRDIDFKSRRLHVQQTVLSVEYKLTFGRPKTKRGERKIALDPETIRVLREHGRRQQQEKALLGFEAAMRGAAAVAEATVSRLGGSVITEGEVTDIELITEGGFDHGTITAGGAEMTFWNEFMTLDCSGRRLGTFPDLIMTIDARSALPVTTAEITKGERLIVVSIPAENLPLGAGMYCAEQLKPVEEIVRRPILQYFGLKHPHL